jgi:hypothetical protein
MGNSCSCRRAGQGFPPQPEQRAVKNEQRLWILLLGPGRSSQVIRVHAQPGLAG